MVEFFEYLSRPTAGDKKESVHLQHVAQMRNLLDAIDPHGNDILCLLDHEGDAVWKLWVKPNLMEKKKKPGIIILYLTSYAKFLTFVTHKRFTSTAPAIHPDYIKDFETVKADLKGWRSTVHSQSYDVRNKRFVDESEGLLTLQELTQIKSSKMYNNAIRLIIQAGQGKELNVSEFVDVQDFLITRFSLDTGTRPGPLNNSTLEEFSAGKVKDDCKVMLVAKHKRAKNGPAICPMLPELYKFMNIYVRQIRPYFAKSEVDALFVTREGLAFKEGTIGCRLSSFVEKCGVRLGSQMAFVDMRKVITQMLKKSTPEEKSILRCVLTLSKKTSCEWYTRPDLTSIGIEAANIIQRLLASSAVDKEANKSSLSPLPGKDVAGPSTITEPDIHEEAESNGHDQQAQTCSPPPQTTLSSSKTATYLKSPSKASTLASGIVPPSPPVKSLTEIQKGQINRTFKKEREQGNRHHGGSTEKDALKSFTQ